MDYDTQYKNRDGTPSPKIVLEKVIGDGKIIIVGCVSDASSKKIHIISARKTKSDNGQVLNMESEESPQPTSKTPLDGIVAKISITDKTQNVNGKGENNSGKVSYSLKSHTSSDEECARNSLVNRALDQVQKPKDLKLGTYHNVSEFNDARFRGSIERLPAIKFLQNARHFAKVLCGYDSIPIKRERCKAPLLFCWWTIKDSNLGPTGYEPVALTN